MARYNRKICNKCRVTFVAEIPEQNECFRCLVEKKERKIKDKHQEMRREIFGTNIITTNCEFCNKEFKTAKCRKEKACSEFCRNSMSSNRNTKDIEKDDPIKKANEKWLLPKKNKKNPGFSYEKLNKRSEYKRVFDDKGWDHYLKGKKWDTI